MVHEVRAHKKRLRELKRQQDIDSMKAVLQDGTDARRGAEAKTQEDKTSKSTSQNPDAIKGRTLLTIEQEIVAQVDKAFKTFTEEGFTHRRAKEMRTIERVRGAGGPGVDEGDLAVPAADPRARQQQYETEDALETVRNPSAGFWQRNPRLLRPLDDKQDVAATAASAAALRRPPIATITVMGGEDSGDIGQGTWKTHENGGAEDDEDAVEDQTWQQRDASECGHGRRAHNVGLATCLYLPPPPPSPLPPHPTSHRCRADSKRAQERRPGQGLSPR